MRSLALCLAAATLASSATGCLTASYKISGAELARLTTLPPEQRGQQVRVVQELSASDVDPADPVDGNTQIVIIPVVHVQGGGGYQPRSPVVDHRTGPAAHGGNGSGGSSGGGSSGKAADAKDAAIALVVLAAVAFVAVAVVEAERFDGWAQLHPMFPLHLIGKDGQESIVPLAQLDPQAVAWADHAVVRGYEGPFATGPRAPLSRQGLAYSLFFGGGSLQSADGSLDTGTATTIQLGYFPTQSIGVVGSVFFGWRQDLANNTMFESRYTAELQALPVAAGPLHLGLYGGLGGARRFEDGYNGQGNRSGGALTGGAMFQLDVNTRLALTARLGIAESHGEEMKDILVGMSVY
jgi:hypothetical protein